MWFSIIIYFMNCVTWCWVVINEMKEIAKMEKKVWYYWLLIIVTLSFGTQAWSMTLIMLINKQLP